MRHSKNATIISHVILDDGSNRVTNAVSVEIKSWVSGGLARDCNIYTKAIVAKVNAFLANFPTPAGN